MSEREAVEKLLREINDGTVPRRKVKAVVERLGKEQPDVLNSLASLSGPDREFATRYVKRCITPEGETDHLRQAALEALKELEDCTESLGPDTEGEVLPRRNWRRVQTAFAPLIVPVILYPDRFGKHAKWCLENLLGALGHRFGDTVLYLGERYRIGPKAHKENHFERFFGYPLLGDLGPGAVFPQRAAMRVAAVKKALRVWAGEAESAPPDRAAELASWELTATAQLVLVQRELDKQRSEVSGWLASGEPRFSEASRASTRGC